MLKKIIRYQLEEGVEGFYCCSFFSATKYVYASRGYDCGVYRKPFKPLDGIAKKQMDAALKKLYEVKT